MKPNLAASLLLLVIFLAGLTSGMVAEQLLLRSRIDQGTTGYRPRAFPGPRAAGPPGTAFSTTVLARRLALSAAQDRAIDSIIRENRLAMDSILTSIRPDLDAGFRSLNEAIRALPTPEQQIEFDSFVDEGFERLGGRNPLAGPFSGLRPRARPR